MVMETNNPYIEKLYDAHKTENEADIKKYTELSGEYVKSMLPKVEGKVAEVTKSKELSLSKQYKEIRVLYKQAEALLLQTREIKKVLRETMARGKTK